MLRLLDHPRLGTILALVIGAISRTTTDVWTYVFLGVALVILVATTVQWVIRKLVEMGSKRRRHQEKPEKQAEQTTTPAEPELPPGVAYALAHRPPAPPPGQRAAIGAYDSARVSVWGNRSNVPLLHAERIDRLDVGENVIDIPGGTLMPSPSAKPKRNKKRTKKK